MRYTFPQTVADPPGSMRSTIGWAWMQGGLLFRLNETMWPRSQSRPRACRENQGADLPQGDLDGAVVNPPEEDHYQKEQVGSCEFFHCLLTASFEAKRFSNGMLCCRAPLGARIYPPFLPRIPIFFFIASRSSYRSSFCSLSYFPTSSFARCKSTFI